MKKTFTINISGTIFHIDDDAYEKLQAYLNSLSQRFSGNNEGKEIIADIEARIAEIFTENFNKTVAGWEKQVITIDDVLKLIDIMGEPDEFEDGDNTHEDTSTKESGTASSSRLGKRLYRHPDDRILGGVAGGLAAYFAIDPVIIRALFILLAFTSIGIILYVILWVIMPVAQTTTQKLEMEGKNVTITNIEKSINKEFKEMKNSFNKFKSSQEYKNGLNLFETFMISLGKILKVAFKIIIILIGITLIILGVSIILGIFGSFFSVAWFVFPTEINQITSPEMFTWIAELENARILIIGLLMLIGIPIISIIYGGFRLIFNTGSNYKLLGFAGLILWLTALVMTVSVVFIEGRNFKVKAINREKTELNKFNSNTLYVKSQADTITNYYYDYPQILDFDETKIIFKEGNHQVFILPKIDIIKSENNEIEIVRKQSARAKNRNTAYENAKDINYKINQMDSLLTVDAYSYLEINQKWRNQNFELVIKLPVGMSIFFDKSTEEILYNSNLIDGIWPEDLINTKWEMTERGLKKSKEI